MGDGGFAEAMDEAAYGLRDVADQYVEALSTGVQAANALGTVSVASGSPEAFYDNVLIPLKVLLDEANVPEEGRYVVIPPWLHGRALRDDRFISAEKSGAQATVLGNGRVGSAAGFSIRVSNNAPQHHRGRLPGAGRPPHGHQLRRAGQQDRGVPARGQLRGRRQGPPSVRGEAHAP